MARAKRTQVSLKSGKKVFCLVQKDEKGRDTFSFNRGVNYFSDKKEALRRSMKAGTLHHVGSKGAPRGSGSSAPTKAGATKAGKATPTKPASKGGPPWKGKKKGKAAKPAKVKKTSRVPEEISELYEDTSE